MSPMKNIQGEMPQFNPHLKEGVFLRKSDKGKDYKGQEQ